MSFASKRLALLFPLLVSGGCGLPASEEKTDLQKLGSAVDLADSWLGKAKAATSSNTVKNRADDVSDVLNERDILLDGEDDDGPCAGNTEEEFTLAYVPVPLSSSPIHVCQETMVFSEAIIAQVLLHEGLHGAGNSSECSTTQDELEFMILAGQRPFKNAYVDADVCAGYSLGDGVDFVILEDGSEVPVPRVALWTHVGAPKGARYVRVRRSLPSSLLVRAIGPESLRWLSNIFPFLSR